MSDAGWLKGNTTPDERQAAFEGYLSSPSSSDERAAAYRDGVSVRDMRKRLAGVALREQDRRQANAEAIRVTEAKKVQQAERLEAIGAAVDPLVDDGLLDRLEALRLERGQTYVRFFSQARTEPDVEALTRRVDFSYGEVANRLRSLLLARSRVQRTELKHAEQDPDPSPDTNE